MSEPVIPSLELAHDNSAMGTNSPDTYGLHLEVDAPEAWVYVPAGRFPDYTPQIVVSALADNTAAALCVSSTAAGQINVTLPARAKLTAAGKRQLVRETDRWRQMARAIALVMGEKTIAEGEQ